MSTSGLHVAVVRRAGADDGVSVLRVATDGGKGNLYLVKEVSCQVGGRGWVMHRLGAAEPYHVRVGDPSGDDCDCRGFLAHGRCRHVRALRVLTGLDLAAWAVKGG